MTEYETKKICWSCGRPIEGCICGKDSQPIAIKPPKEVLPICGGTTYVDEPWADPKRYKEVMLRPCCQCETMWLCDRDEWIRGKCPNCGASGPDGTGSNNANYHTHDDF